MRPAVLAGFALALVPAAATAQTTPYSAVVSASQVELRAGPSDKYPQTGTLPRGTEVKVDHEEPNGWLAVSVPFGAAVSWVPTQFIEKFDATRPTPYLVNVSIDEGVEVTVAAGQVGMHQPLGPLGVRRTKVPNGTILTLMGPPVKFDNKTWLPVEPPPGDFRYLPKSAVQSAGPITTTNFVVRDNSPPDGLPGPATSPRPAPATPPRSDVPKQPTDHPLWAQAEAAEKDGRLDEAEKLYFQLARAMNEPGGDHDVANLCYTRIHALREKKRTGAAGGSLPPAAPSGPATAVRTGTARPEFTAVRTDRPRDDRPALLPPVSPDKPVPASSSLPPVAPAASTSTPPADPGRPAWTGPGMLVRSPIAPEGRQTFALESAPGVVRAYVSAAPGVDLKTYVNRHVDLLGTAQPVKGLAKPFIVVTEVNPNP